jgi:hypothetical protein
LRSGCSDETFVKTTGSAQQAKDWKQTLAKRLGTTTPKQVQAYQALHSQDAS